MFFQTQKRPGCLSLDIFFLTQLCLLFLMTGLAASAERASNLPDSQPASAGEQLLYLPLIRRGLTPPLLQPIALACGSDSWTVNWDSSDMGVVYELQEAHAPDFANPTVYTTTNSSQLINSTPSAQSLYYYRVRGTAGSVASSWSNTVSIVGSFFDTFADPNSGWADTETSISIVGYDSGSYFVRTKDTGNPNLVYLASSLSPDAGRSDYIVEADLRWHSGSATDGLYGLIFGANATISNYYFVAIFPDSQRYRIYFFDSTLPVADRLAPVSPLISDPIIQPGTAVNHVRLERIGESIALQINGISLGSWNDDSLTGVTRAGVLAAANPATNPVVEARYDNFKISGCSGTTAAAPGYFKGNVGPLNQPILPEALFGGGQTR